MKHIVLRGGKDQYIASVGFAGVSAVLSEHLRRELNAAFAEMLHLGILR